jgi:hypothetical protein
MKDRKICELLDISILRQLAESHYKTSGIPIGIIDAFDGLILVGNRLAGHLFALSSRSSGFTGKLQGE